MPSAAFTLPAWLQLLVLLCLGWLNRQQQAAIDYVREENRVLREQLGPRRPRLTDAQRRRLAAAGKAVGRRRLGELATLVTPATILRWYRELIARKYDGCSRRGPGRPPLPAEARELVVRLARENLGFGYTRIRDALREIGVVVGRSTIAAVLREHGLDPAPKRRTKPTWKQFLATHFDALAAADFFHVEVLTLRGLVRYKVFFVLRLATRQVEVAGIARDTDATGAWLTQVGRNLTDACDGFLRDARYLIVDRDPLYTASFPADPRGRGSEPRPDTTIFAEPERLRRALGALCSLGAARPGRDPGRGAPPATPVRVRPPLPRRAAPPRPRRSADRVRSARPAI